MIGSPIKLCDGGLLQSPWGSVHYFLISLTFYCLVCTLGGLGKHMVVKGSSGDCDEVMMGVTNLGDENGLSINVGNNCVGVVSKSANPPRN